MHSPSTVFADKVGRPIGEGIVAGAIRGASSLAEKMSGSIASAMAATQARIDKITRAREDSDNAAALKAAKTAEERAKALETITLTHLNRQLAIEQAAYDKRKAAEEKSAAARLATIQKSLDRVKALVERAAAAAASAWAGAQDKILSAFDTLTGGYKSQAQNALDLIAARRKEEDQARAVADAEKALWDAREDGDPAGITAAELALARAREDIVVSSLEVQAAAEQKAWTDQREAMKTRLEERLASVGAHLVKTGASWNQGLAAIKKIMDAFGIPFSKAGEMLGEAFAAALRAKMERAAAAAQNVLGGVLGPSPENRAGPRGINPAPRFRMAAGGIVTSPTVALIGEAGPEAVIPLSRGGGVGGNVTLVVNMPNYLGSRQKAAEEIYDEFVTLSRRRGALFSRTVGATA